MTTQDQRYALVHDGQVFVCLDYRDLSGAWETSLVSGRYGDTEIPFERRENGNSNSQGGYWFAGRADDAPDAVIVRQPERQKTTGYKLTDERLKGAMPETLTPDEYRPLWDEDSDQYDPVAVKVYEAVTEPFTPEPKVITGILRLDGKPWPESPLTWVAKLPSALSYQRAYLHLFPGHIDEKFPESVEKLLEARGDVGYCFVKPGHLEIHVRVGQVSRKIEHRLPYRIEGPNFAEALKRRERAIKDAEAAVDAISCHVCPTCGGSGTDIPAPAEPKRRRRR
jgi:hypothetical protein